MTNRYLAPKIPGRGDQPSTDRNIGHAHMTAWERKYNDFRPFGSYPVRPEWDELDRDFVAYWQLAMQRLVKEYGRHDIKPVLAIDRWLLPVMRDGADPKAAPDECWKEYDKATTGGGGARSTRNHADGRVLDEKGETVGRWDDNRDGIRQQATSRGEDPDEAEDAWRARQAGQTILDKVKRWAAETHHGKAHVRRWQEAANGIEPGTFPHAGTMTSAEASEYETRFMASRWGPTARAIRDREIGFTGGGTVDAELEETLKVINARPDVEVRKYNPETNTLDVLSPADAAYKAGQDAYADEVVRFQGQRDRGHPDAQQGFDEWKRRQSPNGGLFPFNGIYVMDARTGCYINADQVARRRGELTAENVRYRLDCDRPDGIRQISWLALNYEGCLCWLPHYDEERAETTRMVPAEEIPDLIVAGWRVLSEEEYADNQRRKHARDDRFSSFRLYVQHDPQDNPLGVCPTQGDPGLGNWKHNAELFARLHGHGDAEALLTTHLVNVPQDLAAAINAGDWAEVARLAAERA